MGEPAYLVNLLLVQVIIYLGNFSSPSPFFLSLFNYRLIYTPYGVHPSSAESGQTS